MISRLSVALVLLSSVLGSAPSPALGSAPSPALGSAPSPALGSAQALTSSFVQGTPADEATIRSIVATQSASQEDARVAADLDWENAFGIRYTDLKKRNDWFNANIKPQFKSARDETLEVKVRFIEPTTAVADEYWHVVGQVYAGETKPGPDRWGRTTYIFKKANGSWAEVMERVADLRSPYFKHYETLPAAVPVDPATLASYAGKYEVGGKPFAEVTVTGDHLALLCRGETFVGIPVSSTEFLGFSPGDLASYYMVTFTTAPGKPDSQSLVLSYPRGQVLVTASKVP